MRFLFRVRETSLPVLRLSLVAECSGEIAQRHYRDSSPYAAASVYLAQDDPENAIDCLVKVSAL